MYSHRDLSKTANDLEQYLKQETSRAFTTVFTSHNIDLDNATTNIFLELLPRPLVNIRAYYDPNTSQTFGYLMVRPLIDKTNQKDMNTCFSTQVPTITDMYTKLLFRFLAKNKLHPHPYDKNVHLFGLEQTQYPEELLKECFFVYQTPANAKVKPLNID
jgi:hypothetical protein